MDALLLAQRAESRLRFVLIHVGNAILDVVRRRDIFHFELRLGTIELLAHGLQNRVGGRAFRVLLAASGSRME